MHTVSVVDVWKKKGLSTFNKLPLIICKGPSYTYSLRLTNEGLRKAPILIIRGPLIVEIRDLLCVELPPFFQTSYRSDLGLERNYRGTQKQPIRGYG